MSILITGASSGIGRQLALDYAARSEHVIVCGRNQEALEEVQSKYPEFIDTLAFDITDKNATIEALSSVETLNRVILCAGVCEYLDTNSFDADMFERVFRVNVFGTMNCVEAALPKMGRAQSLSLWIVWHGLLPFTKAQAYGGSKAAMHYITRSLEVDLKKRGIRVQSVSRFC